MARRPAVRARRQPDAHGWSDDAVLEHADLRNLHANDVAGLKIARRPAEGADTGGRAGGDDIAGRQRQERREIGDQFRYGEDKVARAAVLYRLAIDPAAQMDVIGIGE